MNKAQAEANEANRKMEALKRREGQMINEIEELKADNRRAEVGTGDAMSK